MLLNYFYEYFCEPIEREKEWGEEAPFQRNEAAICHASRRSRYNSGAA
jgi:hypothetical protein